MDISVKTPEEFSSGVFFVLLFHSLFMIKCFAPFFCFAALAFFVFKTKKDKCSIFLPLVQHSLNKEHLSADSFTNFPNYAIIMYTLILG